MKQLCLTVLLSCFALNSAPAFAGDGHLLLVTPIPGDGPVRQATDPDTRSRSFKKFDDATETDVSKVNVALGVPDTAVRQKSQFFPGEYYRTYRIDTSTFEDDQLRTSCGSDALSSKYIVAMVSIEWQPKTGIAATSSAQPISLFAVGDAKSSAVTHGCLISSAWIQTGPFTLFTGTDQDDYIFHFSGLYGSQKNADTLAQIAKLGLAITPFIPAIGAVPATVATLANTAAPDLDKLFSSNDAYSYLYKRKFSTNRFFKVTSDFLPASAKYVSVYEWKSASLILDAMPDGKLAPGALPGILGNPALGAGHRCWAGVAGCQKEGLFEDVAQIKIDTYADYTTPETPAKPSPALASWTAVATACDKIKATATNLGLTPIDALIVRRAILEKYGVIDALYDAALTTLRKTLVKQLRKASPEDAGDVVKQVCWSTKDEAAYQAITTIANR